MKEIKKIGILAAARIGGILGALMGLIYAIVFLLSMSFSSLPIDPTITQITGGRIWVLIFLLPLTYLIYGFFIGIIISALYNLITRWVGGIEIELNDAKSRIKRKK